MITDYGPRCTRDHRDDVGLSHETVDTGGVLRSSYDERWKLEVFLCTNSIWGTSVLLLGLVSMENPLHIFFWVPVHHSQEIVRVQCSNLISNTWNVILLHSFPGPYHGLYPWCMYSQGQENKYPLKESRGRVWVKKMTDFFYEFWTKNLVSFLLFPSSSSFHTVFFSRVIVVVLCSRNTTLSFLICLLDRVIDF